MPARTLAPGPRTVVPLLALLLLAAACGDEPAPASKRPRTPTPPELPIAPLSTIRVRPVDPLPEGEPDLDGRIAFGIELLERGDIWQVQWAGELLGGIGEPAVAPLAAALVAKLEANPLFARNVLAVFARHLPAPGAVDEIEAVVRGPDVSLRRDAARALANTGRERAIEPMLRIAGDEEYATAGEAVRALERLPAEPVARAVRAVFPEGIHPAHRTAAVALAGRGLPREEAVAFLRPLATDEATDLRVAAAAELARLGRPEGRDLVLELLEAGLPRGLEILALTPLAAEADPAVLPRISAIAAAPLSEGGLQAIALLGNYGSEEAWSVLRRLADSSEDQVASDALYELVRSGAPDARERLATLRESEDPEDRTLAALAHARIAEPWSAAAVAAALGEETDRRVRIKLLNALTFIHRPEGEEAALAALAAEEEPVPGKAEIALNASAALLALAELSPPVLERVVALAREGIPSVRIHAARVLARHGRSEAATAAVASLFESDYPDVRMAGAHAWLRLPDATPAPYLEMAEDEPSRTRARELVDLARMLRHR